MTIQGSEWIAVIGGGIGFIVCLIFIIYVLFKQFVVWKKNNLSTYQSKRVKVVGKYRNQFHIIIFQLDNGDKKEFKVSAKKYGKILKGDVGMLAFKGTRYKGFRRVVPLSPGLIK